MFLGIPLKKMLMILVILSLNFGGDPGDCDALKKALSGVLRREGLHHSVQPSPSRLIIFSSNSGIRFTHLRDVDWFHVWIYIADLL